jgi:hypothetical protein
MQKVKSLDGTEYVLDAIGEIPLDKIKEEEGIHEPDKIIARFDSFGINTKVCVDYGVSSLFSIFIGDDDLPLLKQANVTDIVEHGKTMVIYAEHKKVLGKKVKITEEILEEMDFRQGVGKEVMMNMFSNLFTKGVLKNILECDEVEFLMFNKLMYIKVGDRAYRL